MSIMKFLLFFLICTSSVFASAIGGFTNTIIPYHIELAQEPPVIKDGYVVTSLNLHDDIGTKIAMSPVLLWMEGGLLAYETTYTKLLNVYNEPLAKMQLITILGKLVNGQTLSAKDVEVLKLDFSGLFEIKSPPFVYNFKAGKYTSLNTHRLAGSIKESIQVAKVTIDITDRYNVFMLFPVNGMPLMVNSLIMPPLVFVEFGGLLVAYTVDFKDGKITFFEPDTESDGSCKNRHEYQSNPTSPCEFLAHQIPNELSKHRLKIVKAYKNSLEGKYIER